MSDPVPAPVSMPVQVRPLRPDEATEAHLLSSRAFDELDRAAGVVLSAHTDDWLERGRARVAHLQRTDPDGAWAAEQDGALVGVALATVRERLWFLSLLAVEPGLQGAGTGRLLLEAALRTAQGAAAGWILSSEDPRALRRYASAGFALEPGYAATGTVDRALLPAVPQVRDGSWEADGERVDALVRTLRGAGFGPDLGAIAASGARLLVSDPALGAGFAVLSPAGVRPLGASTPAAAQALLWAALGEVEGEPAVEFLTARQGWAVDVAVQARLALRPAASSCHRGLLGPFTPYLPSGRYG